ncbi:hypothetical protein Y032_0001g266 [Ancylostoma ceylanicum]|uniref:Uncharacterized protein n=1 Tax=Ancylostoma ceylanicum TaxID=53326 RepID=A0A016W573_9BILA|nr:hypothetical protein Y032_0001g266 [Ancylostoma ceylanicum]
MYRLSETTSPLKRSRIQGRRRLPAIHVIISSLRITFDRYLYDINQCFGCDVGRLGGLVVSDTLYSRFGILVVECSPATWTAWARFLADTPKVFGG